MKKKFRIIPGLVGLGVFVSFFTPRKTGGVGTPGINGQPLHYRREGGGQFVLYSAGWNETDDGGLAVIAKSSSSGIDSSKGDWGWRYPVKQVADVELNWHRRQTAILPLRLRAPAGWAYASKPQTAAGEVPASGSSCRFHAATLQNRQRTAPLTRSFIALHSTLKSAETGRMNRQLRPRRGNGFKGARQICIQLVCR